MLKLNTTNIVGSADKKSWSQSQTIIYSKIHQVLSVVQLTSEDEDSLIDLTSLGVEILAEIERKGQDVKAPDQLKKLSDNVYEGVTEGLKVEIIIASLIGSDLAIYGRGDVEAYLSRGGKLAKLKENWGKGSLVQGMVMLGDHVVIATQKFVEAITPLKFKEILTEDDHPAELLAPLLHTQAETSGMAAIVGEITDETENSGGGWIENLMNKKPKILLRNESPKKINLWVGGVILVLLLIMIGVGMVRRTKIIAEKDYESLNSSVNAKLEETVSVGDLNPDRARFLLAQSRSEVEAYLATDLRDDYRQKANKLMTEIDLADERAFKKNDIKLSTIVELSILSDGLKAEKMKSDGKGNLIFLDTENPKIVGMNLIDRSRQIINISQSDDFVDLGINENKVFGLNGSGVTELFWKKEDGKKVIEPDEFWSQPTNIAMFAGNAYILDKGQGEIWKYPTLGDTFGGRRRWFAVGITPDLSNVVDMKVVGDIWLLTSTGKLERYSRGAPVTFGMEGFPALGEPKKMSNPSALWVTDSLVYVLENGAKRIVVFGEDGKYSSQYVNSELEKATDLVIVDDKGYVLIDNMVKEFGL